MYVTESGMNTDASCMQPVNAFAPMLDTERAMDIVSNPVFAKVDGAMAVSALGIDTKYRFGFELNAPSPIDVTDGGRVMLVK